MIGALNTAAKFHVAAGLVTFQGGPGIYPAPKTFNPIQPPPLKSFPPSLPSPPTAGGGVSPLTKSGNEANAANEDLLNGIDDAANGEYDESSEYMKKLQKDIEAKKLQQQKEEKEFLDKGVKEQNDKDLTKKYDEYQKAQEKNKQEEDKLKKEQEVQKQKLETKNEELKKATTEEEKTKIKKDREAIQAEQKTTQKKSEELREKQRTDTHTMHYDYDQHLEKKPQTPEIKQERDNLKYVHDRWQHLEKLGRDFDKTKNDYFINPETADWRTKPEFDALPQEEQTKIKAGYKESLLKQIKPSLENLRNSFGSGKSSRDQAYNDTFKRNNFTSKTIARDLVTSGYTGQRTPTNGLEFSDGSEVA